MKYKLHSSCVKETNESSVSARRVDGLKPLIMTMSGNTKRNEKGHLCPSPSLAQQKKNATFITQEHPWEAHANREKSMPIDCYAGNS